MDTKIDMLHRAYCQATGFDIGLRMGRDRAWFDFDKAGFTKEDLLLVIAWIKRQTGIARSGYTVGSLRFSNLLQLDYFEERLQLARADARSRQRKPATVMREQRVGDISRQVEVAAEQETFATAGDVGNNVLSEWLRNQKNPPSSK